MYDKTVRRRRAVLGLLVVSSLILLTAYFGESAGGGLHSVQRGALEVVSPIQSAASRALKPARDLFGWAGDTLDAKGDAKQLRKENEALRQRLVAQTAAAREIGQIEAIDALAAKRELTAMGGVDARVIGQDPSLWYSQIQIDKGSSDGIAVDQPVINGQGLVGVVSFVSPGYAIVRLITDHNTGVGAKINESGFKGTVEPETGRPTELVLNFVSSKARVDKGQTVVTSGTESRVQRILDETIFPPNIPIGRVSRVDNPQTDEQQVHLVPFVDLNRLEIVRVLTEVRSDPTS